MGHLAAVRERIAAAATASGRSPDGVTLVAVTKTFPVSDTRLLAALGIRDVGENRAADGRTKRDACSGLPLRWHHVGQVQTNKCRDVAAYADVVHAVDRPGLVPILDAAADRAGRRLECLVQVSLDGDLRRGGAPPEGVVPIAELVARTRALDLRGVMAVAPRGADPDAAFAALAAVAADLRRRYPEATAISAGMSGDLEAAVRHGATYVRVGTALLGGRRPRVG